ncbi:unnamed protein product, partial [marine sediment metagenome]
PKVGDRIEFSYHRGKRKGEVIGIAESGVHFLIEMDEPQHSYKWMLNDTKWVNRDFHRRIPLHKVIRILNEVKK